jgi:hypothetical protein
METDKEKATKAKMYDADVDGDSGSDAEMAKRKEKGADTMDPDN